jgi:dihydrofolate synthase/folylpolyglutamate synthase
MTYAEAVAHLHALGPELAPAQPGMPRRKYDLEHMRRLSAALGNPHAAVPSVLIAGTNGKGSTAATLASILAAAGYRTGMYTSPHLTRVNERIQLSHSTGDPETSGCPIHPRAFGEDGWDVNRRVPYPSSRPWRGWVGGTPPGTTASSPEPPQTPGCPIHPRVLGEDGWKVHRPNHILPVGPTLTPISDEDFAHLYTLVDQACERLVASGELPHLPSFFERLTAIAFAFFAGADLPAPTPRADILVLEVGLGGRLDATNIVQPLVSVITDIALDHQDILGETIAQIAREKCGILRENGTLVTLSQHPQANQAIGEAATKLNVWAIDAAHFLPPAQRNAPENEEFSLGAPSISAPFAEMDGNATRNRYTLPISIGSEPGLLTVDSPLPGAHQQRNIALALATIVPLRDRNGYIIPNAAIEAGIQNTRWPGRLEWIAPNLLLDVAHNPAGAWTLRAAIAALPPERPRTLLFSCLRDKNLAEMSRILFPLFDSSPDADPARSRDHIVLAPIPNPRAASLDELRAAANSLGIPAHAAESPAHALELAQTLTPPGGIIVATGSVYLIGELRSLVSASEAPASP